MKILFSGVFLKSYIIVALTLVMSFFSACRKEDKKNRKTLNLNITKEKESENKKKLKNYEFTAYVKSIKNTYRKDRKYRITGKNFLSFDKIYKKIKKNIVKIGFYIKFEKFSAIPDIYKDKVKENEHHIFTILGVYIGKGYVLSELNLLDKADNIFLKEDKYYNMNLIAYDKADNLALLKFEKVKNFKKEPLDIQNISDDFFKPGDLIFTVSYAETKNLSLRKSQINFMHYSEFYDMADALYSEGISSYEYGGGVVFDENGEFVGLTSLYDSYYEYSNYIIPVHLIKKILPSLKEGGNIEVKPWLGIYTDKDNRQVIVKKVIQASPADKTGLKKGDVIKKINNIKVITKKDMKRILSFCLPGNYITLEIERNGKNMILKPKLTDKPLNYIYGKENKEHKENKEVFGLVLSDDKGLLTVKEVYEGSIAYLKNIRTGDIILEVAGKKVKTVEEFKKTISNFNKNDEVKLKYLRGKEVRLSILTID